jgi:hypothetical protein
MARGEARSVASAGARDRVMTSGMPCSLAIARVRRQGAAGHVAVLIGLKGFACKGRGHGRVRQSMQPCHRQGTCNVAMPLPRTGGRVRQIMYPSHRYGAWARAGTSRLSGHAIAQGQGQLCHRRGVWHAIKRCQRQGAGAGASSPCSPAIAKGRGHGEAGHMHDLVAIRHCHGQGYQGSSKQGSFGRGKGQLTLQGHVVARRVAVPLPGFKGRAR